MYFYLSSTIMLYNMFNFPRVLIVNQFLLYVLSNYLVNSFYTDLISLYI